MSEVYVYSDTDAYNKLVYVAHHMSLAQITLKYVQFARLKNSPEVKLDIYTLDNPCRR